MSLYDQGGFAQNQVGTIVTNEVNWFNIAVKVRTQPVPLLLFRVLGHGGLVSAALPWLALPFGVLWRLWYAVLRLVTLNGDEEQRSLELATSLSLLMGVPLSSPMEEGVRVALHILRIPSRKSALILLRSCRTLSRSCWPMMFRRPVNAS